MRPSLAIRVSILLGIFAARLVAAEPTPPATLPSDWIDPDTGHRIIRLSPDTGASGLYFHQNAYTPEGDKIVLNSPQGIVVVALATLGISPPKREVIAPDTRIIATAWRTREAYVRRGDAIVAIHLDTKAVREVCPLPAPARVRGGGNGRIASERPKET
jgi:oligogalacturonide lyase